MPILLPPSLFLPGVHFAPDTAGGHRPGPPGADLPAESLAEPVEPAAAASRMALAIDLGVIVAAILAIKALLPAGLAPDADWGARLLVPAKMLILVLAATWLLHQRGEGWGEMGLKRPAALWHIPAYGLAAYLASSAVVAICASIIFPMLGVKGGMGQVPAAFASLKGDTPQYFFWLIPVSWGSAAFGEEMLYRGFILNRLGRVLGGGRPAIFLAVLAQAVFFGVGHSYLGLSGALVAGLMGMMMGLTFLAAGRNLWPAIIAHGLTDSISMTVLYLGLAGH